MNIQIFFFRFKINPLLRLRIERHDTKHNDTKHNDIQHNDIQQNEIQHNIIQYNRFKYNEIQHNDTLQDAAYCLNCNTQNNIFVKHIAIFINDTLSIVIQNSLGPSVGHQ